VSVEEHDAEYLGSQFALEIDGVEMARFTGCSGLGWDFEVTDTWGSHPDGTLVQLKRPGRVKYNDITLKRGLSKDTKLTDWADETFKGEVARKTGSIVIYNAANTEVGRWDFQNGWISKWSGSDLSADSDDVMIEEVTIVHEYLQRM
jgi:phage tail-like protein